MEHVHLCNGSSERDLNSTGANCASAQPFGCYSVKNSKILITSLMSAVLLAPFASFAEDKKVDSGQETKGAWNVVCKDNNGTKRCAAIQQMAAKVGLKSNVQQRMFAIELLRKENGARGTLILPFGLAVSKGITINIDGSKNETPVIPFKTCLQAGCIVELEFGAESLEKLKSARELNVNFYIAENDQKQTFDISLDGFEQAFEQIASSEGK